MSDCSFIWHNAIVDLHNKAVGRLYVIDGKSGGCIYWLLCSVELSATKSILAHVTLSCLGTHGVIYRRKKVDENDGNGKHERDEMQRESSRRTHAEKRCCLTQLKLPQDMIDLSRLEVQSTGARLAVTL